MRPLFFLSYFFEFDYFFSQRENCSWHTKKREERWTKIHYKSQAVAPFFSLHRFSWQVKLVFLKVKKTFSLRPLICLPRLLTCVLDNKVFFLNCLLHLWSLCVLLLRFKIRFTWLRLILSSCWHCFFSNLRDNKHTFFLDVNSFTETNRTHAKAQFSGSKQMKTALIAFYLFKP